MTEQEYNEGFGNSWLKPGVIKQICYIAACKALYDAHHPGDVIVKPQIEYTFIDTAEANTIIWSDMYRVPERDWEETAIIEHYDHLDAKVAITPSCVNHFHSAQSLECFFYRRFAEKEGFFSRTMPYVAKGTSIATGAALLGLCIHHCIEGKLHPMQALSLIIMVALPAIIAANEYKNHQKPDKLRQHYADEVILDSIKSEYRYLRTTPNFRNHIEAKRLIGQLDKYRPEKRFTHDEIEIYRPENYRRSIVR